MIFILNRETPAAMRSMLYNAGHQIVLSKTISSLPAPISTHPDIQIHSLGPEKAICAPECFDYYRKHLPEHIQLLKGMTRLSGTYPGDCAYNVARIGKYIFCNTACTDSVILDHYQQQGKYIIHVNQGYTKCNLCIISDDLVLTEDVGIHNVIIENHLPISIVLLPKGEVALHGFPYGFIGGASGDTEKTVYWYGNPNHCSYFDKISDLCCAHAIESIALSHEPLQDLGGIICFP